MPVIGLDGEIRRIGKPGIYSSASSSPDGKFLLVTKVKKPFSYLLPYSSFPHSIEVWDTQTGEVVHSVADVPMAENIPIEGVRIGPRNVEWASSEPATLVWMEALDNGDPNQPADFRDRLMRSSAPFSEPPSEFVKLQFRSLGASYFADPNQFIAAEYDRDRRWIRSMLHDLSNPSAEPKVLVDRSVNDQYGNPGSLVCVKNQFGHWIVLQDGESVYRIGRGATEDGDLPFIDRQNLSTFETERLWRCEQGTFEGIVELVSSSVNSHPK